MNKIIKSSGRKSHSCLTQTSLTRYRTIEGEMGSRYTSFEMRFGYVGFSVPETEGREGSDTDVGVGPPRPVPRIKGV